MTSERKETNLGTLIKFHRKKRKWSLRKLADESGMALASLSYLERGTRQADRQGIFAAASALGITKHEIVQAWARDRLTEEGSEFEETIESYFESSPAFADSLAYLNRHYEIEVQLAELRGVVDDDGHVTMIRTYQHCRPTADRQTKFTIRERAIGAPPDSAGIKVIRKPRGQVAKTSSKAIGGWHVHTVEFLGSWPKGNTVDFHLTTEIPGAFVLDPTEYRRRLKAEGLPRRAHGHWVFHAHNYLEIRLKIEFPDSYRPTWESPLVWPGGQPPECAHRNLLNEGTSERHSFEHDESTATFTVRRPIPGYNYAIVWTPPDTERSEMGV